MTPKLIIEFIVQNQGFVFLAIMVILLLTKNRTIKSPFITLEQKGELIEKVKVQLMLNRYRQITDEIGALHREKERKQRRLAVHAIDHITVYSVDHFTNSLIKFFREKEINADILKLDKYFKFLENEKGILKEFKYKNYYALFLKNIITSAINDNHPAVLFFKEILYKVQRFRNETALDSIRLNGLAEMSESQFQQRVKRTVQDYNNETKIIVMEDYNELYCIIPKNDIKKIFKDASKEIESKLMNMYERLREVSIDIKVKLDPLIKEQEKIYKLTVKESK